MLLQFNVTNFLSFKNETILSLYANKDKEHIDFLIPFKKEMVLPSVSIYGANAAGKSNINKALVFAIMFVRNSSLMQIEDRINVTPFLLDEESRNNPSRFDFIFVCDNTKYEYGFTVDQYKVIEEYLYEYKTNKPSMIFERSDVSNYKFSTSTKRELSAIVDKNTENKLFLSTATLWNSQLTKKPYMWFVENIDVYDSENLINLFVNTLENENDESMKQFICKLLKNADVNIVDYDFEIKDADSTKIPLPPGIQLDETLNKQISQTLKEWKLSAKHQVIENGVVKNYELPLHLESKGTANLFYLGTLIRNVLKNGKTMVIDELDTGLHPILVKYLIQLFNSKSDNPYGAQLIFNTHDVTQLSLDQFRRDQIYFVEKDNLTGISDLYSLDEYSPRKKENIQKGYMQGRYGAIPIIETEGFKW